MSPKNQPRTRKRSGATDVMPAILNHLSTLQSFTGWDGKTLYTIAEIKPYRVPGNAARVQGKTAVWLRSPKSKRSLIIFPELIQAAMDFIQRPEHRGAFSSVCPTNFSACVSHGPAVYRDYPHFYSHAGIYLALAKIMLGMPADWEEEKKPTKLVARPQRRNIRTIAGLLEDVIDAYVHSEGIHLQCHTSVDLSAHACDAIWSRHGRATEMDERDALRNDLAGLWERARQDPDHKDIIDVPILMFALLYLNGLEWLNRIRGSAVTSVVNRLADAHDAEKLQPLLNMLIRQEAMGRLQLEKKMEYLFVTGRRDHVWNWRP